MPRSPSGFTSSLPRPRQHRCSEGEAILVHHDDSHISVSGRKRARCWANAILENRRRRSPLLFHPILLVSFKSIAARPPSGNQKSHLASHAGADAPEQWRTRSRCAARIGPLQDVIVCDISGKGDFS